MKNHFLILRVLQAVLLLSMLSYCTKQELKVAPTVTAIEATNITSNSATAGGKVTADGGDQVTVRGICWSPTNTTPTISDSKTSDGTGIGSFSSLLQGLLPGTTYSLRAYATNSIGTAYSGTTSFKTLAVVPVLTTTDFSSVSATSFNCGGNVTSDGGSPVTARGVCWSTNQNPTIADTKTTDGTGTGSFTSSVTGLASGLTFFVRAYATNSSGTAYGNQITSKTLNGIPTIENSVVLNITTISASGGGNISSDGGSPITARGVCWSSINATPTILDNKTTDGTGSGLFSSSISGLIRGTTYNLRAYATNSTGTAYSSTLSFKTLALTPVVTTNSISDRTSTSFIGGGNVTDDGGSPVSARGICWNNTGNPTVADNKTIDGTGTGAFTSPVTGLIPFTWYYWRSYATNNMGTTYGDEYIFRTLENLPTIPTYKTTTQYNSSAKITGTISYKWDINTNIWENFSKTNNVFDSQGYIVQIIYSDWDKTTKSWINRETDRYSFFKFGKMWPGINYKWDTSTNSFKENYKYEYSYNANQPNNLWVTLYTWSNYNWKEYLKYRYDLIINSKGNIQQLVKVAYSNTQYGYYDIKSKSVYIYSPNGSLIDIEGSFYNGGWTDNGYSNVFTFDKNGNPTQKRISIWDSKSNKYILNSIILYTYDSSGKEIEHIEYKF